jgi:hypothetical protein
MVLFDAVSRPPRELLRPETCPFDSTASLVAKTVMHYQFLITGTYSLHGSFRTA